MNLGYINFIEKFSKCDIETKFPYKIFIYKKYHILNCYNYIQYKKNKINFIIKYPINIEDYIWIIENTNIVIANDKNITIDLIEKYQYRWDYHELSKNPNLTEEFIMKYPHQDWYIRYLIKNNKITDFKALSRFKEMQMDIISEYPSKQWDWKWLIKYTDIMVERFIPFNLIEKYYYKWNYHALSYNPNLTKEFILKYPYQFWDKNCLSKYNINNFPEKGIVKNKCILINDDLKKIFNNENISHFIKSFYHVNTEQIKYSFTIEEYELIIKNTYGGKVEKYIQLDLIKKYKYKWDYQLLSKNPNLTEKFILKHPAKEWNIKYLINNNKITDFNALSKFNYLYSSIIRKYPNKPWDWEWIIENTNINIEDCIPFDLIEKYKDKWDYYFLSRNSNLTEEFIMKYPYKNWNIIKLIKNNKITDFKVLSKFININKDIINIYSYKSWDWNYLNLIGFKLSIK